MKEFDYQIDKVKYKVCIKEGNVYLKHNFDENYDSKLSAMGIYKAASQLMFTPYYKEFMSLLNDESLEYALMRAYEVVNRSVTIRLFVTRSGRIYQVDAETPYYDLGLGSKVSYGEYHSDRFIRLACEFFTAAKKKYTEEMYKDVLNSVCDEDKDRLGLV